MAFPRKRVTDPKAKVLYSEKFGRVHVRVIGPEIGWKWRQVRLFRYKPSPKDAGQFEQITTFQERDLPHLEQAINAVRKWLKHESL